MLHSMTGFASAQGQMEGYTWTWDLRSVNGKGLDLRLRLPEWIDGLEPQVRARLGKVVARGNVTLSLRVQADEQGAALTLNTAQLGVTLSALTEVETQAMERGVTLAPSNAADILALRGVMEPGRAEPDTDELRAALLADLETLIENFAAMRAHEGAAVADLLTRHLDEIEKLTDAAAVAAEARKPEVEAALRAALARVMQNAEGVDAGRITQELALLAVKADVTEEIDRLKAHVTAARELLTQGVPVGRKLDFLAQEFNREANTLCSKSQSTELTNIGLALKTGIDQMREQVQNVE